MAGPKNGETVLMVGTRKGLWIYHSKDRKKWTTRGPYLEGSEVHHAILDPHDHKTIHAGANHYQWGPVIKHTKNFGSTWTDSKQNPHYSKESGLSVKRTWQICGDDNGALWAGVEPAGLFRSIDGGYTWEGIEGFNAMKDRDKWPPGNGGLCLHSILPYPGQPKRMVVAVSSAGIFGTKNGGKSWRLMNNGIRSIFADGKENAETDLGCCPHKVVRDPIDPKILYQQNHAGVYTRKRGDARWQPIEKGLPSVFGFGMAIHPREAGTMWTLPLTGDFMRTVPKGALSVYRTTNAGKKWEKLTKGLPQEDSFVTILRDGLCVDDADPVGVYFGTTTGAIYSSRNEGDSWKLVADRLPQVFSVEAAVVGG